MPESSVLNLKNCSYQVTAVIDVEDACEGVIVCQGGNMAGWSLYLSKEHLPTFHYNWFGHEHTQVQSSTPLGAGKHTIEVNFVYDGGFGKGGELVLSVDGSVAATGRIDKTVTIVFSRSGETFDVGVDKGSPVGLNPHHFPCSAKIHTVTLDRLDEPSDEVKALMRKGEFKASLSTQ